MFQTKNIVHLITYLLAKFTAMLLKWYEAAYPMQCLQVNSRRVEFMVCL